MLLADCRGARDKCEGATQFLSFCLAAVCRVWVVELTKISQEIDAYLIYNIINAN